MLNQGGGRKRGACDMEAASGSATDPWSTSFTVRVGLPALRPKGLGGVQTMHWLHATSHAQCAHADPPMRCTCLSQWRLENFSGPTVSTSTQASAPGGWAARW
jgi:hypothetical protein